MSRRLSAPLAGQTADPPIDVSAEPDLREAPRNSRKLSTAEVNTMAAPPTDPGESDFQAAPRDSRRLSAADLDRIATPPVDLFEEPEIRNAPRSSRKLSAAAAIPMAAPPIDMSALQQPSEFIGTADFASEELDMPESETEANADETQFFSEGLPASRGSYRASGSFKRLSALTPFDQEDFSPLPRSTTPDPDDMMDDAVDEREAMQEDYGGRPAPRGEGVMTSSKTDFFRTRAGKSRTRRVADEVLDQVRKNMRFAAMDRGGERINWRLIFNKHDKNNSGTLRDAELKNLIRKDAKLGKDIIDDYSLRYLFNKLDVNGDGDISIEEFVAWFADGQEESEPVYDKNDKIYKADASYFEKVRMQASLEAERERHAALRKRLRAAAYDRGEVNWKKLFKRMDKDHSGEMDLDEFLHCIRREGKVSFDVMSDQDLIQLFKFIDKSGDGRIHFQEEFITWLDPDYGKPQERKEPTRYKNPEPVLKQTSAMIEQIKTKLRAAAYRSGGIDWKALFSHYDRDNSGEIDFAEFRAALRKDGKITADLCSEAQLQTLFSFVDANRDGKVEYDTEFVTWMNNDMDLKQIAAISKKQGLLKAADKLSSDSSKVKTMGDFLKGRKAPEDPALISRIEELKGLAQRQAEEIERLRADHARELQTLHSDYDGLTERLEKAGVVSGDELRRQFFSGDKTSVSSMGGRTFRGATSSAAPSESGLDTPTWDQSLTFTEASQQGGTGRGELFDLTLPLMNTHSSKKAKARALANLRNALETGSADPNMWKGKSTPLHAAVKSGNIDYVALLLEYNADPNTRDEQGVSVLHMATFDGQLDLCILLMDSFADPNNVDQYNQSPLFFAPTRNLCELLFQRHADTNLVNVQGQTSLHLAGKAGFEDVLIWLARHMPRGILELKDSAGKRGLDYAIESNVNPAVFKRLHQWEPSRESHISSKDHILKPAKAERDEGEESEEDEMLCRLTLQAVKQKLKAAAFWQGGCDWKKLFESYDDDATGELSFEQFLNCIREGANICESMLSEKGLKQLFNSVDTDGGGTIHYYHEFLPWLDPDNSGDVEEDEDEVRVINTPEGKVFMVGTKKFTADQLRNKLRVAAYDNGSVNWRKVFKSAMNESGDLTFDKFRIAMRKQAKINADQMPDAVLAAVFNVVDVDQGGQINFEDELLPWLEEGDSKGNAGPSPELLTRMNEAVRKAKGKSEQREKERYEKYVSEAKERLKIASFHQGVQNWKRLFQRYDKDRSGEINFEEFYAALRKSAKVPHNALSDGDIKALFDMLDNDKDGLLNYEKEFLPWVAEDDLDEALRRGSSEGLTLKGSAAVVVNRFNNKVKELAAEKKAVEKAKIDASVRQAKERLKVAAYTKGKIDWKTLFMQYDVDNSGEISFDEFQRAIRKSAKITVGQLSEEGLRVLFSALDVDGGGSINYEEEFIPWIADEQEEADIAAARFKEHQQKMFKTMKDQKLKQQLEFEAKVKQARDRMRVAAYQFGRNGRMDVKRMFKNYDADGSGEVDFEEFKMAVRKGARVPPTMLSDADLQTLFNSLDSDGGGCIDYESEFAEWLMKDTEERQKKNQEERKNMNLRLQKDLSNRHDAYNEEFKRKVKEARERLRVAAYGMTGKMNVKKLFEKYDTDGSGEVDLEEFKHAVRKIGKVAPSMLSDADLEALFDCLDVDGGGTVDYESEFTEFLLKENALERIQRYKKKG